MPSLEGYIGALFGKRGRNAASAGGLSELAAALLIQEAGGRYSELAWNGVLYTVSSGLVAAPTGVSPLAAAGTPMLALWNPVNSGYIALLLRIAALTTASGTVSAKAYALDGGPTAAITQATIQRGQANLVGVNPDNDLQGFTAVALTGSTALQRLMWLNAVGNAVAQTEMPTAPEDLQGAVILMPGSVVAITAAVAGTANEAAASITYAKLSAK